MNFTWTIFAYVCTYYNDLLDNELVNINLSCFYRMPTHQFRQLALMGNLIGTSWLLLKQILSSTFVIVDILFTHCQLF